MLVDGAAVPGRGRGQRRRPARSRRRPAGSWSAGTVTRGMHLGVGPAARATGGNGRLSRLRSASDGPPVRRARSRTGATAGRPRARARARACRRRPRPRSPPGCTRPAREPVATCSRARAPMQMSSLNPSRQSPPSRSASRSPALRSTGSSGNSSLGPPSTSNTVTSPTLPRTSDTDRRGRPSDRSPIVPVQRRTGPEPAHRSGTTGARSESR